MRTGAAGDPDGAALPVRAEIELQLDGSRLAPTLEHRVAVINRSDRQLDARIGLESATTMLGGGGNPEAWWELGGTRTAHDATGAASAVERLAQGNGWLGVEVRTAMEPAADAWYAPIETISNSEAGFERVYQGSALLISWLVHLAPGDTFTAAVRHEALIAADRATDEASA